MPLSVRPEPIRTASEAAPRLVWPNSCPEPSNTRSGSPLATLLGHNLKTDSATPGASRTGWVASGDAKADAPPPLQQGKPEQNVLCTAKKASKNGCAATRDEVGL